MRRRLSWDASSDSDAQADGSVRDVSHWFGLLGEPASRMNQPGACRPQAQGESWHPSEVSESPHAIGERAGEGQSHASNRGISHPKAEHLAKILKLKTGNSLSHSNGLKRSGRRRSLLECRLRREG